MALSEQQTRANALFLEGNRHLSAGDAHAAMQCFQEATLLAPDFAEAYANLGMLHDQEGRHSEAERLYRLSISLNPGHAQTHMNLGVLLFTQKRFDEAQAAYRRALKLCPESDAAWSNLGALKAYTKQEREAERCYKRALAINPDNRNASFNLGCLLLGQGRYEDGWRYFESRDWYARLEGMLACPRWRGEPLRDRSLLIGLEAGHGDMIQFCRYAPLLKAQGASRITLICHPALKTLFTTLHGVDEVFAVDDTIPDLEVDFWTPPLSIPRYYRTRLDSIPGELPYLHPDKQLKRDWEAVLSKACTPGDVRIGLVWKGNPRFQNDSERSLPDLGVLLPLGDIADTRFFSLQKGPAEAEAASVPQGLPVVNLGPKIADFADTAAIAANLDLVICVDTAMAHLAGALGRPCWVLLPDYMPDWRWLNDRFDSPWYPRVMRLFRQSARGEWAPVIRTVREALKEFVRRTRASAANTRHH